MENKYKNGKIYKIVCNITNEIYIGSTVEILEERLRKHILPGKNRCMSRNILDRGDYEIILIKNYPCNSKEELLWEERRQLENNICVNKRLPIMTKEEKKEKIKERKKIYREKNKEELSKKEKEYREKNKEKRAEKRKIYTEKNKEKIKERKKIYNEEKINCLICNLELNKGSLSNHLKTKKHLKNMVCKTSNQ